MSLNSSSLIDRRFRRPGIFLGKTQSQTGKRRKIEMNLDLPEQPIHVLKMIANEVQMRAVTSPLKFFEEAMPLLSS